jgi:hypothetical protein
VKRTFILFMVGFAVVAIVGYALWLIFDTVHTMYKDRRLSKELDELESWQRERKKGQDPPPPDAT